MINKDSLICVYADQLQEFSNKNSEMMHKYSNTLYLHDINKQLIQDKEDSRELIYEEMYDVFCNFMNSKFKNSSFYRPGFNNCENLIDFLRSGQYKNSLCTNQEAMKEYIKKLREDKYYVYCYINDNKIIDEKRKFMLTRKGIKFFLKLKLSWDSKRILSLFYYQYQYDYIYGKMIELI